MIEDILPHEAFQIALKNAASFPNVVNQINTVPNVKVDPGLPVKNKSNDILVLIGGAFLFGASIYVLNYYIELRRKDKNK